MNNETNHKEKKPCPLCGTMLNYDRWVRVVGIYEEQQRHREQLEKELGKAKEQSKKLQEEYSKKLTKIREDIERKYTKKHEIEMVKFEKQKKQELRRVQLEAIKVGMEKQKRKTERVAQTVEKLRKERNALNERVKQLEEMIKNGTTPQSEGLDYEKTLADQLKQRFPEDQIISTGKRGDIIQTVRVQREKAGKIIYECKKTQCFKESYVKQILRDKAKSTADYGVIVTHATKEKKQGFWVEEGIIVVHPFGVLDIATFLREAIIQMHMLKLTKEEAETKGKALLEYISSEEFKATIQGSIAKSEEAYRILKEEVKTHFNTWEKRYNIYKDMYRNSMDIREKVKHVVLSGKIPVSPCEVKEFPPLPLLTSKTSG